MKMNIIGSIALIFGIYSLMLYEKRGIEFYNQLMWTLVILMWIVGDMR